MKNRGFLLRGKVIFINRFAMCSLLAERSISYWPAFKFDGISVVDPVNHF